MTDFSNGTQLETGSVKRGNTPRVKLATVVSVAWTLYTLAYLMRIPFYLDMEIWPLAHRSLSVGLICILVFLCYPARKDMSTDRLHWYDLLPICFVIVACSYIILRAEELAVKWGPYLSPAEMVLGVGLMLCVAEAVRRTVGWILPLICVLFFFYMVYSNLFPGFLYSTGQSYNRAIGWMYLSDEGLWGMVTGIVSTVVAGFIIFGAFLKNTGASGFFTDLALSLAGSVRGGAAKAAVVTSTLFGTISGSVAANVATTGTITIPLMKRTGYSKIFAGAVESCSSTGGMFMPPVMGATAFLIAEFLEMSYWSVCVAAFGPAVVYYLVLFVQVDLQSAKENIKGLPREQLPSLGKTLQGGWQFLLPLVVLVVFLGILRYTPEESIIYALGVLVIISFFKKETRLTPRKLLAAIDDSGRGMILLMPVCASVGIIIATAFVSGVGINLSSGLVDISGGNLLVLLLMAAGASIVLGTGLPAVACYILTVLLMAPAVIKAGIAPIAAHLFLFYYGTVCFITPPVCMAVYIAVSISGGDIWKTAVRAMRLGAAAFLVPFAFVFNPSLLMIGSAQEIVLSFVWVILGGISLAVGLGEYLFIRLSIWQQIMLVGAGIGLFVPNFMIKVAALSVIALIFSINLVVAHRAKGRGTILSSAQEGDDKL